MTRRVIHEHGNVDRQSRRSASSTGTTTVVPSDSPNGDDRADVAGDRIEVAEDERAVVQDRIEA